MTGFEDDYSDASCGEPSGGGQTSETGADDDDVGSTRTAQLVSGAGVFNQWRSIQLPWKEDSRTRGNAEKCASTKVTAGHEAG